MTAIAVLATKAAGYIATDTALYKQSGMVVGHASKAVLLPHIGLAISVSGTQESGRMVEELLTGMASYDDAIERLPGVLREAWDDGSFHLHADDHLAHFRLFLAGWSERRGGEAYYLSTVPGDPVSPDPFVLMKPVFVSQPSDTAKMGVSADNIFSIRPVDLFGRFFDVAREHGGHDPWGNRPGYFVGGAGILTEVSEAGIRQVILRRWGDPVGEVITPTPAVWPAPEEAGSSNVTTMSRQMRRALDRKQGRR